MRLCNFCRQELQRDVHRYMVDPSPVTKCQVSMEPDSRWEPPWDAAAHTAKGRAEAFRIAQLNAWGRWVWLAAELIPRGGCPAVALILWGLPSAGGLSIFCFFERFRGCGLVLLLADRRSSCLTLCWPAIARMTHHDSS